MTLASVGPDGQPHLVAMWFALIDGDICFETKAKSQKAVNLRRNPQVSCLAEDGVVYEDLRGVSPSRASPRSPTTPTCSGAIGVNLFERYYGPYTEDLKPVVEVMLNNRVAVTVRQPAGAVLGPPQARDALDRRARRVHDDRRRTASPMSEGADAHATRVVAFVLRRRCSSAPPPAARGCPRTCRPSSSRPEPRSREHRTDHRPRPAAPATSPDCPTGGTDVGLTSNSIAARHGRRPDRAGQRTVRRARSRA